MKLGYRTTRTISRNTGVSQSTILRILKSSGCKFTRAALVPHELMKSQKIRRVVCSREMLKLFDTKKSGLIITGDEIWINHNNPSGAGWIIQGEKLKQNKDKHFGRQSRWEFSFPLRWSVELFELLPVGSTMTTTDRYV